MGNHLFQAVQKPNSGNRAGTGDGRLDARNGQIARLLSGHDLRGLLAANLNERNPDVLLRALSRSF